MTAYRGRHGPRDDGAEQARRSTWREQFILCLRVLRDCYVATCQGRGFLEEWVDVVRSAIRSSVVEAEITDFVRNRGNGLNSATGR